MVYIYILPVFVKRHLIAINVLSIELVYCLGTLPVSHLSTLHRGEEGKLHTGECV